MNILSIDFDWIMYPSIEAYNMISRSDKPLGVKDVWDQIETAMPGCNFQCDLNRFAELYFLLKNTVKNLTAEDCFISLSHNELYDFMQQINAKKYNVYNIDHHHDLGYHIKQCPVSEQPLALANWAAKAHSDLNMYRYTWIHNPNSLNPEAVPKTLKYTHTTDLSVLDGIKFDKVFICSSWEWVPLKYQNLFAVLVSLFDEK